VLYAGSSRIVLNKLIDMLVVSLLILVPIILSVALFTLAERKLMASIQRRKGPSVVGLWGILQPIADGLKLFLKEVLLPNRSYAVLFLLAPSITFFISLNN
jgi:NADH-quinone oxidoreductase subunit H